MTGLLTTAEAAEVLGYSDQTLKQWRSQGRGPAYIKDGNQIRYLPADLKDWILERRHIPNDDMAAPTTAQAQSNRSRSRK